MTTEPSTSDPGAAASGSSPSSSPDPSDARGSTRLADAIVRHHRAILIGALLVTALGVWRVSRLQLRSDLAELLPARDPAVVVLHEMDRRIAALATLIVGIESPSPAANERFVGVLVQRLRARRSADIVAIQAGVQDEQRFFSEHRWLYAELEQLEDAHDRLERSIAKRKNPLFVDLDDQGGDEAPLSEQAKKLEQRSRERFAKFPGGYFATRDRQTYAVVISVRGSVFGGGAGERVVRLVRETTAALQPARFHAALNVELTGGVISALAERHALEKDLVWATTVSVVLIFLAIVLFYGRLAAVPLSTVPALIGVILALAFAQLVFGYLNSSTAFMGSIIVGNGVNYALIQLARYEEERRFGRSVRDAIAIALRTTTRATATASLGAAVAYGSLAMTSFRGFNQFGYIGGVGMVLSWVATVLVLPALWVLTDRRQGEATRPRVRGFRVGAPLARFSVAHPRLLLAFGAALTLAAVIALPGYARDPFEYDFRKLRNQVSRDSPAERLNLRLGPVFGRSLSHNFIVADDPSQVEEIRDKLRAKDRGIGALGAVRTINDFLPGAPELQRRKLALLGDIRGMIDRNLRLLDEGERADALRLRPPERLRVLRPADLPYGLRRAFTEVDGTIGRPVLYYARENVTVWDGRYQMRLAEVVQSVRLADGQLIRSSGSAVIFAAMLRAIVNDGPLVTAASLLGVVLLVVMLTWRRGGSLLILLTLFAGVLWMVGAAAAADVRVNFLNFIALPITFGIGVDYAVNLYLRYQFEGRGRVREAVEATGAAVALCSLTTIIGYGALLVADNQALRSFGAMAILGEFACFAAALLLLPAALVMLERRRARAESGAA
ncbi:MAG: MMPL family transporter [Proteobacteria bacterium]|nr:MMPL family transporter [Pseudomonadota bacterium]